VSLPLFNAVARQPNAAFLDESFRYKPEVTQIVSMDPSAARFVVVVIERSSTDSSLNRLYNIAAHEMNESLRTDFNTAYKGLRNRFRAYRPESIVRVAMDFLHRSSPDATHEVLAMPWHVLLLVKWVCQDTMTNDRKGRNITPQEFHKLRQQLHDLPEMTDLGTRNTLSSMLLMRQLMRAQFEFQRRYTKSFVREAALLAQQPENYPLRRLFEQKAGVRIQDFLDLALAMYAAMLNDHTTLDTGWLDRLRAGYTEAVVAAFIRAISRDYVQLCDFFRALPDKGPKKASEYYEFPVIKRYPFLRTGNTLECWHPMVFYRGMEGFVHSVLSEAGQDYIDRFSKLFEAHVTSEAAKVRAHFLNESQIASFMPPDKQVPDVLLSFPGCNIFVESKAGLFDESVMIVGHSEIFARKTRALRKAVEQAWSACIWLRREKRAFVQIVNAPKDYLIIVTNRELNASHGTILAKMYPAGTLTYPDEDAERYLPLEHIYVLSIEEFERLIAAAALPQFDLPALLEDCITADKNPETQVFLFEQFLDRRQIPMNCSAIVVNAIESAEARLADALQGRS
jgi:hypothetical protein